MSRVQKCSGIGDFDNDVEERKRIPRTFKVLPQHLRSPYSTEQGKKLDNVTATEKLISNYAFIESFEEHLAEYVNYLPLIKTTICLNILSFKLFCFWH